MRAGVDEQQDFNPYLTPSTSELMLGDICWFNGDYLFFNTFPNLF
jgi:hypothetical protein